MVCSINPSVPVIADADTGFGGPINVARTVKQYIAAGVAGLHIEDQVQTKRCGHLMGKQVVSREEFLTRIRAAVIARDSVPNSDFVSKALLYALIECLSSRLGIRLSLVAQTLPKFSGWRRPSLD